MALTFDDPRHGTTRGHAAGCRELCCRRARNDDEARRRKYRQVLGITRTLDATGTRRRIQALLALGWPSLEIARRCGWTTGEAVLETAQRSYVHSATAAAIASVYDDLCVTPGPSDQTRSRSARKGYHLPSVWLDIDDPDEQPDPGYVPYSRNGIPSEDLLAEFDWLVDGGVSRYQAARQLGVTLAAVEKARERARSVA